MLSIPRRRAMGLGFARRVIAVHASAGEFVNWGGLGSWPERASCVDVDGGSSLADVDPLGHPNRMATGADSSPFRVATEGSNVRHSGFPECNFPGCEFPGFGTVSGVARRVSTKGVDFGCQQALVGCAVAEKARSLWARDCAGTPWMSDQAGRESRSGLRPS